MKLTITRQNLKDALDAVTPAIPGQTTLPVLSNILLDAVANQLTLTATNLDITLRITVPADIKEPGSLTVPGKKLRDIVRLLPDAPIEVWTRGDQATITCGPSSLKLNGLPADEFPGIAVIDYENGAQIHGDALGTVIGRTIFAVSTEESRPILNAVLWDFSGDAMRMVATNGHRLAVAKVDANGVSDRSYTVPPTALKQVERLFKGVDEVRIATGGNSLGFQADAVEVQARLVSGSYPDYRKVIPTERDRFAVLDRATFETAIKRMAVVASDQTRRIRIHFGTNAANLSVLTPDLGEGTDTVEAVTEGEPLEIGFNASYLLEVLTRMPSERVRLCYTSPERAMVVLPLGDGDVVLDDYTCIVMPLRLLN